MEAMEQPTLHEGGRIRLDFQIVSLVLKVIITQTRLGVKRLLGQNYVLIVMINSLF